MIFIYIVSLLIGIIVIMVLMILNESKASSLNYNENNSKKPKKAGIDPSQTGEHRFFILTDLDKKKNVLANVSYNDDLTLEQLCHDFRNYAADCLKLYYDIEDIRRFICSLAVSHIVILQGMSGTGKTSLAYAYGEFIDNPSVIVPVQPMWKERTDLIGYYNEFTKKFNETTLLQKLYEANYSKSMYITVLDEINIARIEYYFAEFLSLLELPDYQRRNLDVVSNKWDNDPLQLNNGQINLPHNMWFIGTANNDDSTFAISDKVYDRAMVIDLDKKAQPFQVDSSTKQRIRSEQFQTLVREAKKKYSLTHRNLRRIKELDKYLISRFSITFGNRIMQQIKNYVPVVIASGGNELTAIDDILSKKVLRKLEAKNLAYVKSEAKSLVNYIDELFGEDQLIQCKNYMLNIEKNV